MKKKNLAFTVELLGLFILLIMVITVITQVFVMSRSHSIEAKRLTESVILAEDAAEICSSESDISTLGDRFSELYPGITVKTLNQGDGSGIIEFAAPFSMRSGSGTSISDSSTSADGSSVYSYYIRIERTIDKDASSGNGEYARDKISIYSYESNIATGADADGSVSDGDADNGLSGSDAGDAATGITGSVEPIYTLETGKFFGEAD